MDRNGATIYSAENCQMRRGNMLYAHVYFWPGTVASLSGLRDKLLSAKYFAAGQPVKFVQDDLRVRLLDLPAAPPDSLATTFSLTLDGEPCQDLNHVRIERKREGV
jgi:hypothetical protein